MKIRVIRGKNIAAFVDLLKSRIKDFILEHSLCKVEDKMLVAISGGPDSVFLAYAMQELGYQVALAHVNYQLRGDESDQEEILVRKYAAMWQIPLFVKKLDTQEIVDNSKDSLQEVARKIRYDFFEETMNDQGYNRCALAHQADDQSEQALLSLLTGNASTILQKIPVKRERYIRPLLSISRAEIVNALNDAGLSFATDSSNLKNDYLRNRVRNRVLPTMREVNPKADEQLRAKQEKYASQKAFLNTVLESWMQSCLLSTPEEPVQQIDWRPFVDSWGKEHLPLLVAYVLEKWGLHGHLLWQGVSLVDAQVGKKLMLEKQQLLRVRNGLQWGRVVEKSQEVIGIQETELLETCLKSWGTREIRFAFLQEEKPQLSSRKHFYLDVDQLIFPLTLRSWQEGDSMQPLGMEGHKKLSDIFVDEKYTSVQKQEAFVLEDRDKVLLLSDFRIAEPVKLTNQTQRILVVEVL